MKATKTMEDIARRTGVSAMTVSRVLANKGYVSAQTRARVLSAAKRLDYQINRLARQLNSNRTSLLSTLDKRLMRGKAILRESLKDQ